MGSRAKQLNISVDVEWLDDLEIEEGPYSNQERYFVLNFSRMEERHRCIKRYRDIYLFYVSVGDANVSQVVKLPSIAEALETRGEDLAPTIGRWLKDFFSEGPRVSKSVVCQIETFLESGYKPFYPERANETIIDRRVMFSRHRHGKQCLKMGLLQLHTKNQNSRRSFIGSEELDRGSTFYILLSDNLYFYESDEAWSDGAEPATNVQLNFFYAYKEPPHEGRYYFSIRSPWRVFRFSSGSEREVDSWVATLQMLVDI